MTAVLTANNRAARDNFAPPPALKEDGSNYAFRMAFDNGARFADADTTEELLEVLAPGYLELDEEGRMVARIGLAKNVQLLARGSLLANLSQDELDALEDWELNLLAWDEPEDPHGWGDGSRLPTSDPTVEADTLDVWKSKHPLVLLDISYTPFTEVPRPVSVFGDYADEVPNLVWLRPVDELTFLRSLSRIGYIKFGNPGPVEHIPSRAHRG